VVIVHVPLTPSTHHLIDAAALRQMKSGAFLINVSRGAVVDTAALIAALESGETRFMVELSRSLEWKAKAALVRKATLPQLRPYLQRPA